MSALPDELDVTFPCMGSSVRLLVGPPGAAGVPSAEQSARWGRAYLEEFDSRLSRFRPDSELCALNRDPRREVPASRLLRVAVRAALWAANATDGLVDPTLVAPLERAGYARSRAGESPAPLGLALASAPPRRPARPNAAALWREVEVDDAAGLIRRPPGVAIDTGGTGKGLAADAVADGLRGCSRFVVDCGGDLCVGGTACASAPYEIEVEHPVTRATAHSLVLGSGAIATSGLTTRLWRRADGGYAHHLLDPSTGMPAWTGLVSVTASAPTTLEAETLAKAAFLQGPAGARDLLAESGGLLVHENCEVELVGSLGSRKRLRLPVGRRAAA